MEDKEFWEKVKELDLPFDIKDVVTLEPNYDTVWIDTKDGRTYSISVTECEN